MSTVVFDNKRYVSTSLKKSHYFKRLAMKLIPINIRNVIRHFLIVKKMFSASTDDFSFFVCHLVYPVDERGCVELRFLYAFAHLIIFDQVDTLIRRYIVRVFCSSLLPDRTCIAKVRDTHRRSVSNLSSQSSLRKDQRGIFLRACAMHRQGVFGCVPM